MKNISILFSLALYLSLSPQQSFARANSAAVKANLKHFVSTKKLDHKFESDLMALTDEVQALVESGEVKDDYLLCLKGDVGLFLKGAGGICFSLVDGERRFISASGIGLVVQATASAVLVSYTRGSATEQKYGTFSAGTPELLTKVGKKVLEIARTRVGIGIDFAFGSSPQYGKLFLVGASFGLGVDLSALNITISSK